MTAARPRIAVLIDNIGPYHVARIAAAARVADMLVLEASPTRSEYAWDKPALPRDVAYMSLDPGTDASLAGVRRFIDARLADTRIDVVAVPGWSSLVSLILLDWARRRGVPLILLSETNAWDFVRRRPAERLKRLMVRYFAAALVTSDSHAAYLTALGMRPDVIARGYNAVDNAFFAGRADAVRAARKMPALAGDALPDTAFGRYFLSSARFVEKKNLGRLLAGYAAFREHRDPALPDWPLVLLGDGPMRDELVRLRAALDLDAHVHLPGFRQIDALPDFYGSAGAFVLGSVVEQWGLVVNEAMASALPVAVSRRCGCAEVLVEEGITGFTFDPEDPSAIGQVLGRLAAMPDLAAMGRAARRRVDDWGPERIADGLERAARHALAAGVPRPGPAARLALAAAVGHHLALRRGWIRPRRNG